GFRNWQRTTHDNHRQIRLCRGRQAGKPKRLLRVSCRQALASGIPTMAGTGTPGQTGCVPGILGRKVGMTQIFDDAGNVVPVTVVQAGPCDVLQIRTAERDGYEAVQLGFLDKPRRLASRSERGHVAKLDSKRAKQRAAAGVEVLPKA